MARQFKTQKVAQPFGAAATLACGNCCIVSIKTCSVQMPPSASHTNRHIPFLLAGNLCCCWDTKGTLNSPLATVVHVHNFSFALSLSKAQVIKHYTLSCLLRTFALPFKCTFLAQMPLAAPHCQCIGQCSPQCKMGISFSMFLARGISCHNHYRLCAVLVTAGTDTSKVLGQCKQRMASNHNHHCLVPAHATVCAQYSHYCLHYCYCTIAWGHHRQYALLLDLCHSNSNGYLARFYFGSLVQATMRTALIAPPGASVYRLAIDDWNAIEQQS